MGGGGVNGHAVGLPNPEYPPLARQAHASGTVVVQVTIDENGSVISAHAVSGHPLLQAVAVDPARAACRSAAEASGEPGEVTRGITEHLLAQLNLEAAPRARPCAV